VIIVNNTTVTAINWNKTLKEFAESGLPAKTFAEKNAIKPNCGPLLLRNNIPNLLNFNFLSLIFQY
jgi:hypothetical protein